jgi:hypothetical protein
MRQQAHQAQQPNSSAFMKRKKRSSGCGRNYGARVHYLLVAKAFDFFLTGLFLDLISLGFIREFRDIWRVFKGCHECKVFGYPFIGFKKKLISHTGWSIFLKVLRLLKVLIRKTLWRP